MKAAILSLLMLAFWFPLNASATDVYKWLDENGSPSYGERPPEGVDYVKVKIRGASNGTKTGTYLPTPNSAPKATDDKLESDKSAAKKTTP